MNDAISYIRSLADRHGRNADWAETAVTEAATLTAAEALEQNVIEFVASDRAGLLEQLNGYEVEIAGETRSLSTEYANVDVFEPNWRIRLLTVISNPEIVLLLGLIGLYGLMYEGWNPGAIVPGVTTQGTILHYDGGSWTVSRDEAYAPSFGALGLGGITAFIFGAIIMFDSGVPGFGISYVFVIGLGVAFAVVLIWLIGYLLKLRRRGAVSGRESIVGAIAIAAEDFTSAGKVWLEGETWHARNQEPLTKDEQLIVTRLDGLTLDVKRAESPDATTRA